MPLSIFHQHSNADEKINIIILILYLKIRAEGISTLNVPLHCVFSLGMYEYKVIFKHNSCFLIYCVITNLCNFYVLGQLFFIS